MESLKEVTMKQYTKALRLYLGIGFNPLMATVGLFLPLMMLISAAVSHAAKADDDYMSMIGAVGLGHIGIFFFFLLGGMKMAKYKFFYSTSCAKALYTAVPLTVALFLSLLYDITAVVIAALCWDPSGVSDLLPVTSLNTVLTCFFSTLSYKETKLKWAPLLLWMLNCFQVALLRKIPAIRHGFGLPLGVSVLIAAAILLFGIGGIVHLLKWWWERSGRNYNRNYDLIKNDSGLYAWFSQT